MSPAASVPVSLNPCTSASIPAVNCGSSAVSSSLRTTMSSVAWAWCGSDSPASCSARSDSGLFVTVASLVRPLPRNIPTTTKATTIAAIHAPIVRHGCAAAARARRSVMPLF